MRSKFDFFPLLRREAIIPRLFDRLLGDEQGSYLLYMTVIMPVLIGLAGLGSEAGLMFHNHRTLQSAADAAAYSAAVAYSFDTAADINTQATGIVASYGFDIGNGNDQANVAASAITFAGQPAVSVTIARPQKPMLSSLFLSQPVSISVSATAILNSNVTGNCLLALGKRKVGGVTTSDAPDAIHVQGSATLDLGGCGIFSNSTQCTNGDAVTVQGSGFVLAGAFGTAGCAGGNGVHPANIGPPPLSFTQNDGQLIDPYAGISIPSTSGLPSRTETSPPNTSTTLNPGYYPAGITLKGGTTTLQSGVYVLGGPFNVGPGGGTTTVNSGAGGVTLAFTSGSSGMALASNANVSLTAPTAGPTAGFVLMGDSTMPLDTGFSVAANANASFNGTIYLPNGDIDWQGTANTAVGCRQFIVNKINLQGNPKLSNNGCDLTAGQKPIGSIVTLVK